MMIQLLLGAIVALLILLLWKLSTWRDQDNARLSNKIWRESNQEPNPNPYVGGRVDLDPEPWTGHNAATPITDAAAKVDYKYDGPDRKNVYTGEPLNHD